MKELSINQRRTKLLLAGLLIIGAIFIVRLFYVQIIRHDHYEALALSEQVTKFTLKADRGLIYAKDGDKIVPLVLNEPVYTAFADPQEVKEPAKIEALLRRVAGGNVEKGFENKLSDDKSRYAVLAKSLNKKQADPTSPIKNLAG